MPAELLASSNENHVYCRINSALCQHGRRPTGCYGNAPVTGRGIPIALSAEPFPLSQVRLLDGPFRDAMGRDETYLLSLDCDRLLYNFRVNAKLPTQARPYGGWEAPNGELRGHSVGHYLSACSLMYASTGDARFKERADKIVAGFAECQAALGTNATHFGFLSAWPESFIDRVETGRQVWAPWYTLHKIMAGLLDANQLCGNAQALGVLTNMANWVKFRVDRLSEEQMQASLRTEYGGMNEVLANLYGVTGNADYLKAAEAFNQKSLFDPLAAGQDRLNGLHANTQIPKMIGAARQYELTGNKRNEDIASFFWDRVALHRSYVIGGHSDREHFFPTNDFARHLSAQTAETCNTYNMLKLTRHLFSWDPSARTMDFYERALYNHILASQDPDQGMFVYLMSLKPGHFKTYSTPENSFWCCVGTGMENHAKYGDTIYFHNDQSLFVNLFIPSELSWPEKGLSVRQETKFPESDTTRLNIKAAKPVSLAMQIRWPEWSEKALRARQRPEPEDFRPARQLCVCQPRLAKRRPRGHPVGDEAAHRAAAGGQQHRGRAVWPGCSRRRTWHQRHAQSLRRKPDGFGPGVRPGRSRVCWRRGLHPEKDQESRRTAGIPNQEAGSRRTKSPLVPLYRANHERYTVYWNLVSAADAKKGAAALSSEAELALRKALDEDGWQ